MSKIKGLFNKYRELILYVVVGGLTTLVYFLGRIVIATPFMGDIPALIVGQVLAVTFAFFANKHVVFQNKETAKKDVLKQAGAFYSARLVSFFIDLGITAVFVTWKGAYFAELFGFNKINYNKGIFGINFVHNYVENGEDLNLILFLFIGQITILVANYIFSKFVIFKKSKNTGN